MAKRIKTPEQIVREIVHAKPKAPRRKSAVQAWYEQALAEYKTNGAEHLASALAKMGKE